MPRNDFNGDGRSDILWLLHENSAVSNWLSEPNGAFTINDANAFYWLHAWHQFDLKATGDFNGDGRTDVLWQVDQRAFHNIWLSDSSGGFPAAFGNAGFEMGHVDWKIIGTGDFNGDGVDDLLWRHTNGTLSNWLGSGGGNFTVNDAKAMVHVAKDWSVVGTGDFNGDGHSDILWQSDSGFVSNWLGADSGGFIINDANALIRIRVPIEAIGDFNGDGRDDIVLLDDWGLYSLILTELDGSFATGTYDVIADASWGWAIHATGDYNGDGVDDLLWRHTNGLLSNWLGSTSGHFTINDANAMVSVATQWQVADYIL